MQRSLLVQALLDMATGSGGAKLEALVVDAAGTFDAGSGKGYNPVTVPSGSVNVLGEKGVVSNNSVVVTPKAQVVGGWLNSGETSGSGVGVTASELVSGTLNVSSDGVQDVTNYQNISVPSAGHSASAHKGVVTDHSITVTPRSTATQGFVQAGTVEGTPVSVAASELVSGILNITASGTYDVTNYSQVAVSTSDNITFTSLNQTASSSQPFTFRLTAKPRIILLFKMYEGQPTNSTIGGFIVFPQDVQYDTTYYGEGLIVAGAGTLYATITDDGTGFGVVSISAPPAYPLSGITNYYRAYVCYWT